MQQTCTPGHTHSKHNLQVHTYSCHVGLTQACPNYVPSIFIHWQVSRAAVEGYTGEGEPPCVVMALTADSDIVKPSNLSLTVTLLGVREPNQIQITAERSAGESQGSVVSKIIALIKFL